MSGGGAWMLQSGGASRFPYRMVRRGRGRQKKSWKEVIKYELKFIGLSKDMAQDTSMWRSRIKVTEHR